MVLQISAINTLDQLLDTLRVRQQRRIVRVRAAAKLDGFDKDGFRVAVCDGFVRSFKHSTEERVLRGLIEKADGQRIDRDALK